MLFTGMCLPSQGIHVTGMPWFKFSIFLLIVNIELFYIITILCRVTHMQKMWLQQLLLKLTQEIASLMSNYSKTPLIKLPVLL